MLKNVGYSRNSKKTIAVLTILLKFPAVFGAGPPSLFWVSEPVYPGETVLLQGDGLATAQVEIARMTDGPPGDPPPGAPGPKSWTRMEALQANARSVKFTLPGDRANGVYACRLMSGGQAAPLRLINAPDPWWMQGDQGESASPGGWLRVFGRNLDLNEDGPAAEGISVILVQAGRAVYRLAADQSDGFGARFPLPVDLAPGSYQAWVHNGYGGNPAWTLCPSTTTDASQPSLVRIAPPKAWPSRIFRVSEQPGADATARVQAALAAAKAEHGGIVVFPAGETGLRERLTVPDFTLLKGEGMEKTRLVWTALPGATPDQGFLEGQSFRIEDMTLEEAETTGRIKANGIKSGGLSDGFRMRRARVVQHQTDDVNVPMKSAILAQGRNWEVTGCEVSGAIGAFISLTFAPGGGTFGLLARNIFRYHRLSFSLGAGPPGARAIIAEDNALIDISLKTAKEGPYTNITAYGRPFVQDIYYARNVFSSVNGVESNWTFDGSDGVYFDKIAGAAGTTLMLKHPMQYEDRGALPAEWAGASVHILDGKGAGQTRRLRAWNGLSLTLDKEWEAPPDTGSAVSITNFMGRVLLVDNQWNDDVPYLVAYYATADVIFAGNRINYIHEIAGAFGSGGGNLNLGQIPNWHFQCLRNEVVRGKVGIDASGANPNRGSDWKTRFGLDYGWYTGPTTRCAVFRGNSNGKATGGSIGVGGLVDDAVIEGNWLNAAAVIRVSPESHFVYQRDNRVGVPPAATRGVTRSVAERAEMPRLIRQGNRLWISGYRGQAVVYDPEGHSRSQSNRGRLK